MGNECFFRRWVEDRKAFIIAWERSKREWLTASVLKAVKKGDTAIWKLLNGKSRSSSRPLVKVGGSILTNSSLIAEELASFHQRSLKEISSVSPGEFDPVRWEKDFIMKDGPEGDLVLNISDALVVANVKKLKLSSVPDLIRPIVVKLFFASLETVRPLADLIRAVVRTRCFPSGGKIARQIFIWKGKGEKNALDNCRTITMANAILKVCEGCVKQAGLKYWKKAGFPCAYWGQFSGAPESIYIWLSTVECYTRNGHRPETSLTDVSKAFDRLSIKLYMRKLVDYGLPRQLIELIVEFITGLCVNLSWGGALFRTLDRGEFGVPQGSLEGMWNFGVYSDNIQREIIKSVPGINVGGQMVRNVVYADDNTPVNPCPSLTNRALKAIALEGAFNCYRFKPSKCKVIGADPEDLTEYRIGNDCIQRADSGLLLGAVIDGSGINAFEHVRKREGLVRKGITQIKSWRT